MATALTAAVVVPSADGAAATVEETCRRLGDVIRTSVDRIVAGDHTPRLMVALEAHKRLACPVDPLLGALNLPPLDRDSADEAAARAGKGGTGN